MKTGASERGVHFERLEQRILLTRDYGDAPFPYPTVIDQIGARHVAIGPRLGEARDTEANGNPSDAADGDHGDDGVTIAAMQPGQTDATAEIRVQNTSGAAYLDAWIDFNGDGSWGAADERIAGGLPLTEGDHTIRFSVPADAIPGVTYARFRLSSRGKLGPAGPAADGEVEDYAVAISPPDVSAGRLGPAMRLSAADAPIRAMQLVDLNQDGALDMVVADRDSIDWLQHDGQGGWIAQQLAEPRYSTLRIVAGDLDYDGDLDLVSTHHKRLVIHLNDGAQAFRSYTIAEDLRLIDSLDLADLDGDGDLDIVAAGTYSTLAWYENNSAAHFSEHYILVGNHADRSRDFQAVDYDRDGQLELVGIVMRDRGRDEFGWLKNVGGGQFVYDDLYFATYGNRARLAIGDLNRDGDIELLAVDSGLRVLQKDGPFYRFGALGAVAGQPKVGDLDGDGDLDIAARSAYRDEVHFLQSTERTERELVFVPHTVEGILTNPTYELGDLDGDGDLDLVEGGEEGLFWRRNVTSVAGLGVSATQIAETAETQLDVALTRQGNITTPLTVEVAFTGDAAFGVDYAVQGGTKTTAVSNETTIVTAYFPAGATSANLTVVPVADSTFESNETFRIEVLAGDDQAASADAAVVVTMFDPADYGDAPESYSTRFEDGGPQHRRAGPKLGIRRDSEPDGQPTPDAQSDDEQGVDDEDGVVLSTLHVGQSHATATVVVSSAALGAKLDAWIDFDGDGGFSGAGERIAYGLHLPSGSSTLQFPVPATARIGTTYARFRLSRAGFLGPGGLALDGEVEDYAVAIDPGPAKTVRFAAPKPIRGAWPIDASRTHDIVDFDRDGDADIVSIAPDGQVAAYLNMGRGVFARQPLSLVIDLPSQVKAGDLDGDGDVDLAVAQAAAIVWYENLDDRHFVRHVVEVPTNSYWESSTGVNVHLADLDQDGDLDLLGAFRNFGGSARWSWYENLPTGFSQRDGFSVFHADNLYVSRLELAVHDVDRDGDPDIVVIGGSDVVWYENTRGTFQRHHIGSAPHSGRFKEAAAADFNGDGRIDFLTLSSNTDALSLYLYQEDHRFSKSKVPSPPGLEAVTLAPADFDGDGDVDVVVGQSSSSPTGRMIYLENDGRGNFTSSVAAAGGNVALGGKPAPLDIDGDGDLDLFAWGNGWIENIDQVRGADFDSDGAVRGRDFLHQQRGLHGTAAQGGLGDANADRRVDQVDVAAWQRGFGAGVQPPPAGDYDFNGRRLGSDFLRWQRKAARPPVIEWQATFGTVVDAVAANRSPTIDVADVVEVHAAQTSVTIDIAATDPDGDSLFVDARAVDLAYHLDQTLGLFYTGNDFSDWGGMLERWLRGNNDQWYYLTPIGQLFRWNGSGKDRLSGDLVAYVGTRYYQSLHDFYDAKPKTVSVTLQQVGDSIELNLANIADGSFVVEVSASDGLVADRAATYVHAADALALALDQSYIIASDGDLRFNRGGENEKWLLTGNMAVLYIRPDGTLLQWDQGSLESLSGRFIAKLDPRYYEHPWLLHEATTHVLDASLGLRQPSSYSENWGGEGEKWILGDDARWYYVLPDGQLYLWSGVRQSPLPGDYITMLDPVYHRTPKLLHDANLASLDAYYGFYGSGIYRKDWAGAELKWIRGDDDAWFYITPAGSLNQWGQHGDAQLSGRLIAELDARIYEEPSLLHDAADLFDRLFAAED